MLFQAVALEWLEKFKREWSDSHLKGITGRIRRELFPWIAAVGRWVRSQRRNCFYVFGGLRLGATLKMRIGL